MVEFMQDFMQMKFGLKAVAAKNSASFIKGLGSLSQRYHPYGTMFCQVLHISTEQPLDPSITTFLTKARAYFVEVMSKLGRISKKPTKEESETGGSLPVFEVVDLIPRLFQNDMKSGETLLSNLKANAMIENESLDNFSKYTIALAGRMDKSGKELPKFFAELGLGSADDTIPYSNMIEKLNEELHISHADAQAICERLDTEHNGTLNQKKVTNGIIWEQAADDAFSEDWVVTKAEFLNQILHAHEEIQDGQSQWLKKLFDQQDVAGNNFIDSDQLTEIFKSVNPEIDGDDIERKSATLMDELNIETMNFEIVRKLAYQEGLGGMTNEAFTSTFIPS